MILGAIVGDVIGSVHEHAATKTTDFPLFQAGSRFTDDSVMTVATADAILSDIPYGSAYRAWGRRYPDAGYGGAFRRWLKRDNAVPYGSWGNGSAMRVSPVAYAFESVERVLEEAERSAIATHNHAEGIKGAQATALAVYLARGGATKADIRRELEGSFEYDLSRTIDAIRPDYRFDVSCQGSVPEALIAFLETTGVEPAIRAAISLGGDADTQAAIAGAAAAAFDQHIPPAVEAEVRARLPDDMLDVLDRFTAAYSSGGLG